VDTILLEIELKTANFDSAHLECLCARSTRSQKESNIKAKEEKTDILPGILRGQDFECNCKVQLVSHVTKGENPGVAVKSRLRIISVGQAPPDGNYSLDVHGRTFKIRCTGGKWPTLRL